MKQLKELKLNDTVLTADEVEQKINAAVSGVAPDGNLLSAKTVCADTVCSGASYANVSFINGSGTLTFGTNRDGTVNGPVLLMNSQYITTTGAGSRGNFSFNSYAGTEETQVARIKEVREEIDAKLAEFTPSNGSGVSIDEFNGLKAKVDAKADKAHTHKPEDVSGLVATLGGKANAVHEHTIDDVDGLSFALSEKALSHHTHSLENVEGLAVCLDRKLDRSEASEALAGKAPAEHTHSGEDVPDLVSAVERLESGKADKAHTHGLSDVNDLAIALAGKQDTLTPGANISIINGVISATGGSGGTADLTNYYTKAEVCEGIEDAKGEVLGKVAADYYCKTEIDKMVLENLPEHTHEISEVTGLEDCLTSKQGKLKQGTNITIAADGTISAAGGGGSYSCINENTPIVSTDGAKTITLPWGVEGNDYADGTVGVAAIYGTGLDGFAISDGKGFVAEFGVKGDGGSGIPQHTTLYLTNPYESVGYVIPAGIDTALSNTSINPVQNKAVATAISALAARVSALETQLADATAVNP